MKTNDLNLLQEFVENTKDGLFTGGKNIALDEVKYTIFEQIFLVDEEILPTANEAVLYGLSYTD